MSEHTERLFCPLKQHETRQDIRRDRKYYVGRCDEQKCSWWLKVDKCCAIVGIVGVMENFKFND